jgi:hypothetical protein
MCPHERYTLHVTNRGTNVDTLTANAQWAVDISSLPRGPCRVTVRSAMVSYPECTVTDADPPVPTPELEGIREISVHSNLNPRGVTTETTAGRGLIQMSQLYAADLTEVVAPAVYTAAQDLPGRTLPALGEPVYHVNELPRRLIFQRQWTYDESGIYTSVIMPDAMDADGAYVSFTLDIEYL